MTVENLTAVGCMGFPWAAAGDAGSAIANAKSPSQRAILMWPPS